MLFGMYIWCPMCFCMFRLKLFSLSLLDLPHFGLDDDDDDDDATGKVL